MPEYGHGQPALDSNPIFGIDAKSLSLRDPNGPLFLASSNLIFQTTDTLQIALKFEVDGIFAAPWTGGPQNFEIRYFAEDLTNLNADVLIATVLGATTPGLLIYDVNSPAPSATGASVNVGAVGMAAGTYKITAVVTFTNAVGLAWPIAAFYEGPVIQVF